MLDQGLNRRGFLRGTAGTVGGLSVAAVFQNLLARQAMGAATDADAFGPLVPVKDETTGLELLKLPEGFRYVSYGWTGDPLADGTPTPGGHDGMAVVLARGNRVTLVRNHELRGSGPAFPAPATYNPSARGGTTNLAFDRFRGRWLTGWPSLSGTSTNCAGGPTPWNAWLTGEETLADIAGVPHGWLFEVPALQTAQAVPLKAMGRFSHEAAAVDLATGYVYETEDDRYTSGFYRFLPNRPNKPLGLQAGGTLQMLKALKEGKPARDLIDVKAGDTFQVEWVTVKAFEEGVGETTLKDAAGATFKLGDPGVGESGTDKASVPFADGWSKGASRFRRLEGCWEGEGVVYFDDTEGGAISSDTGRREGAIWSYDPRTETLRCIYAAPTQTVLDNPDNVTVGPDGSLFLCEDGDLDGQRIQRLTLEGAIEPFAQNNIVIAGGVPGKPRIADRDYREFEWAGAAFEPSGEWMFANIQTPGVTFAITGPWPWLEGRKPGRRPVNF